jgi:hypothetical protein
VVSTASGTEQNRQARERQRNEQQRQAQGRTG